MSTGLSHKIACDF